MYLNSILYRCLFNHNFKLIFILVQAILFYVPEALAPDGYATGYFIIPWILVMVSIFLVASIVVWKLSLLLRSRRNSSSRVSWHTSLLSSTLYHKSDPHTIVSLETYRCTYPHSSLWSVSSTQTLSPWTPLNYLEKPILQTHLQIIPRTSCPVLLSYSS